MKSGQEPLLPFQRNPFSQQASLMVLRNYLPLQIQGIQNPVLTFVLSDTHGVHIHTNKENIPPHKIGRGAWTFGGFSEGAGYEEEGVGQN